MIRTFGQSILGTPRCIEEFHIRQAAVVPHFSTSLRGSQCASRVHTCTCAGNTPPFAGYKKTRPSAEKGALRRNGSSWVRVNNNGPWLGRLAHSQADSCCRGALLLTGPGFQRPISALLQVQVNYRYLLVGSSKQYNPPPPATGGVLQAVRGCIGRRFRKRRPCRSLDYAERSHLEGPGLPCLARRTTSARSAKQEGWWEHAAFSRPLCQSSIGKFSQHCILLCLYDRTQSSPI